jgi:uncharacterized protein with PhoU and TrkA domain
LIAGAVVLFVTELLPIEATAIALLALLMLTGILRLEDALTGLSNKAVPTIACMFTLSHALARKYHMAAYLTEVRITPASQLVGQSCVDVGLSERYDFTALAILRGSERHTQDVRDMPVQPDDIMIVRGTLQNPPRSS